MQKLKYHISTISKGLSIMIEMEKGYVITNILCSIISPLTPYVNIFMSAKIVDELLGNKNINTLMIYVSLVLILNISLSLLNSGLNHLLNYHLTNLYKSENMHFARKNMNIDYECMEDSETTYLRERILQESRQGFNAYYLNTSISGLVASIVQIVMSSVLTYKLFMHNGIFLGAKIIMIFSIMIVVYLNFYVTKNKNKINMSMGEQSVPLNVRIGFYMNFLSNYNAGKDVRLYAMEGNVSDDMTKLRVNSTKIFGSHIKQLLKYNIVYNVLNNILNIGIYIFMVLACVSGGISIGSIAKYVSCVTLFIQGLNNFILNTQTLCNNNKYLERYIGYFNTPSKLKSGNKTLEKVDKYELEFKNVSFKYPKVGKYILKNISLKLKEGNKIAVVGMSGSGKTTMIKLLCRLYDPTEGEITLNGINIKEYDYKEYLKAFGIVFQDFKLFSFSIGQNISINENFDKDKITDILEKVGFKDRLKKMKHGVDTGVYKDFEDEGVEISGGEAQKIALARSIYKDAKFIILDEPTAALDPIAESEIYSKFNEIVEDKTTVYISHRLASCKFCDDILVFEDGEIIERGSHNELVGNLGSKYYELWNAQAKYYQVESL